VTPEDEADALRRLLARRPRPELAPDFTPRLMRRVRESSARRPARGAARVALVLYWLAAAGVSAWILAGAGLAAWAAAVAGLCALLAVPAGFAIALWPRHARVWLAYVLVPLAPPGER
jgi:hypothetical protein